MSRTLLKEKRKEFTAGTSERLEDEG